MKLRPLLLAALVLGACSRDTANDRPTPTAEDATATGTAGHETSGTANGSASPGNAARSDGDGASRARSPEPRSGSPEPGNGPAARDARAAAHGAVTTEARASGTNVSAAVLEDFRDRVDQYMELRQRAAKAAPALKETDDPARIEAAQDGRAAAIRAQRAGAKPGDIFTPEIRHTIRQLLAPEVEGEEGRATRQVLRDDAPAPGAVPLDVNARYPDGAPLPTVPATLLANLPELPKGLEYRFIGKDLVLLDSDANLIVDYIRNAIG